MCEGDVQKLIAEFNKQFHELRKDFNTAIEKLSDKISHQGEISISCAKDIEAVNMLFEEKMKEVKKDLDGIAQIVRNEKKELIEYIDIKIKKSELATRLAITLSICSGMGVIIMFLVGKLF